MRWKKISEPLNEKVEELSRILAVPKIIASLLLQRGIEDFDTAKHFFRPEWSHLYDPLLMQDMEAAVLRSAASRPPRCHNCYLLLLNYPPQKKVK